MDLLISYLPNLYISMSDYHVMHFFYVNSLYVVSYPCIFIPLVWWSIIDLLFQLIYVCVYWWNMFLWHIAAGSKYLEWKNHIDPFIRNDMIIGSPHILSSPYLYISISYFHVLRFFALNSLYVVSYPCIFIPLLWWSIIGHFVSIDVCLFLSMEYISMIYFYRR